MFVLTVVELSLGYIVCGLLEGGLGCYPRGFVRNVFHRAKSLNRGKKSLIEE